MTSEERKLLTDYLTDGNTKEDLADMLIDSMDRFKREEMLRDAKKQKAEYDEDEVRED